jgi:hypothetical protein
MVQAAAREISHPRTAYSLSFSPRVYVGPGSTPTAATKNRPTRSL